MGSPFLIEDPRIRVLWDCWRQALRPGRLPRRDEIDPDAFKDALPIAWLYRLDDSGRDFYCALAGEEIVAAWGRPGMIGMPISHLFGPAAYETLRARWLDLLDRPAAMHGSIRYNPLWAESRPTPQRPERLSLPLNGPDGHRHGVLGATSYAARAHAETDATAIRLLPPRIVPIEEMLKG
ncbi:MAG: PAS domain-containing protein [Alphaproteobacteria bacterium]|nr:PAS domain-containing protein [Alphaproteobacteria bacterium]